jgi:hypothetical protein
MQTIYQNRYFFFYTLFIICLSYFGFELFYNNYAVLCVDDFWFAHRIYQFKSGIPYRDFAPYKTVLGYYLLLPSMELSGKLLQPLYYTKDTIALINTSLFLLAGLWLRRFFSTTAILTCLTLVIGAEFNLSYSTDIRVDLLGYWLGLISVLFLLEKKPLWAGFFIGLGFLCSQKIIWYIFASNVALSIYWLLIDRNWKMIKNIFSFNLTIIATITVYVFFWAWFSDLHTVLKSVFYEAYIMYKLDSYNATRKLFWAITLINNPFLFLAWPITLISLFITPTNDLIYKKRAFIIAYASVILLCLIPYKQVFPYYMVVTIPAFILLYTAFFSWLYKIFESKQEIKILWIGKSGVWALIFLYIICLISLSLLIAFPAIYLLISLIPLFLGLYITNRSKTLSTLILLIIFFTGIIYPLTWFTTYLTVRDNHYQTYMLKLTHNLLQDGGDYIAGIELIYNRTQPITGMRHLGVVALAYLAQPSEKLREGMLDSLYMAPAVTAQQVVKSISQSSVKLYVNNYRMMSLPPLIKNYLASQYEHFWGSIYLYAPLVEAGHHSEQIKFNGEYKIESNELIYIDHVKMSPNSIVTLTSGKHDSMSSRSYRLKFIPHSIPESLNQQYQTDLWEKMLN